MAALLSLREMRTRHAKPPVRLLRRAVAVFILLEALLLLVLTFAFSGGARAEDRVKGDISVFTDGGFGRLVFRFDQEVPATVREGFPIMVVTFTKPVSFAVDKLTADGKDYISAARLDPDGTAIRIALTHKIKVNMMPAAEKLFIDLLPETWSSIQPGLPQDVVADLARRAQEAERLLHIKRGEDKDRKPQTIRVRVATLPSFVRYVFDLPEGVNAVPDQHDGKFVVTFDRLIKWDLGDTLVSLPPTLSAIQADMDFASVAINFVLNGAPKVRSFHEDRAIVVDVSTEGAPPKEAEGSASPSPLPPGMTGIGAPETMPAEAGQDAKAAPAKDEQALAKPAAPAVPAPPAAPPPASNAERPPEAPAAVPEAPKPKESSVSAPPAPKLAAAEPKLSPPASPPPAAAQSQSLTPQPAPVAVAEPAPPKVESVPPEAEPAPKIAEPPPPAAEAAAPPPMPPPKPAPANTPAPDPKAPVRAEVHKSASNMRIEFPFTTTTPAAVFRRGDMLWLVFDSPATVDLTGLTRDAGDAVREAHFDRLDGAAVVRLKLARPRLTGVISDGPAWIVDVGDIVLAPTKPLTIARSIAAEHRASIAIPFDKPRVAHRISDPVVGDKLIVVTALAPARGFLREQDFVELRALPSAHGVVMQPLADDLTAEMSADKIIVSRPLGLALSATAIGQQQVATNFRAMTFDTQVWGYDRSAEFHKRQADLIHDAAMAPPQKRRIARLNLARFYLAKNMSAEALAVLDVTLADERGADDVTGTVLKAIANIMFDRPADALKALSNPQVGNQLDAPVWRAVAYARQGKWGEAHDRFKATDAAVGSLPIELQRMALRYAFRGAIEVHDYNDADKLLNEIQTIGVPDEEQPSIAVLVGRMSEGMGRNEDALANYRSATAAPNDRGSAAAGRLHEIMLRYALGDMPRKEVIDQLETLTTIWRGDETEIEGLKLLAHLYTEEGRYRDAFHVMRTALLAHPDSDLTRKIQDEAAVSFEALFLGGKSDALPPIEALGLFYDYRELTPVGRRGDEMIRKLADRLVSVDLLDQAAELLQHQIDHRLQGVARAQVATRLAIIYLMNRKADRALAALRASRADGLSNELRDERLLLEARALSETGRHDVALEIVNGIDGKQALRLRGDILWAARRWREAAEQTELLYGERWKDFAPLNEAERTDILRAAIGYSMADEGIGLGRLREKYTAKMADTPDRHAFEVVTAPTGPSGTEFQNIARAVSGLDTLDAFLRDMRERYPDTSPPAGEGDKGALAKPEAATPDAKPGTGAENKATDKAAANAKPAAAPLKGPAAKVDQAPTGSIKRRPRG